MHVLISDLHLIDTGRGGAVSDKQLSTLRIAILATLMLTVPTQLIAQAAGGNAQIPAIAHYESQVAGRPRVIVFVHGFTGDSVGSWLNSNGAYFPRMLASDTRVTQANVFVASYDTHWTKESSTIASLAVKLFVQLDGAGVFNDHKELLASGKFRTVDFLGAAGTVLTSLNPSGEMSGESCVVASCTTFTHSFVLSKKGTFTSFDPPGAISSVAVTVIPSGAVFGSFTDSAGGGHGYKRDLGTFSTIDFPGAAFTFTGGANAEEESVGLETDAAGVSHSFLLSHGVFTSFDPPGAIFSDAAGIDPPGVIVGIFVDSANMVHGYIRTP